MNDSAEIIRRTADSELIAGYRNGDKEAISELFRRHHPYCMTVARRILFRQDDALDAVQSAYLSAFRNLGAFRGDSSFSTWMTRIVINQCLMHLRQPVKHQRFLSLHQSTPSGPSMLIADRAPTPEHLAVKGEISKALLEAAARLPERLREVFTLCAVSEFSVRDASKALGLTVQATKTRLFRARARMRAELKPFWANASTHRIARRSDLHRNA